MNIELSLVERRCSWMLAVLFGISVGLLLFASPLRQEANYHSFADQRSWGWIPYVGDVLSNLAFLVFAVLGVSVSAKLQPGQQRHAAFFFFFGLLITSFGSTWYHWHPDDQGLLVDRLAMVLPFSGLLSLAVGARVSQKFGLLVLVGGVLAGVSAVLIWWFSSNFWAWTVFQGGGMLLILMCSRFPSRSLEKNNLDISWVVVIAIYAIAKLFEVADHEVFSTLGDSVSGHSLKHLVAAFAAWPVIIAIRAQLARQS